MAREPLYRRIPEDGKHPANSKKNPGAISGAALDDKTNKPSGASDFMPVEISEEEYLRAQKKAVFWGNLAEMGMDYVSVRFQYWWRTKALPKIVYDIIPSTKIKVVNWGKHTFGKEGKKAEQTGQSVRMTVPPKKESTTIALTADLESAYQNYTVNMSSEEAQKELFEAFVLQYLSMKKLQKLSNARIVDAEGNVIDGADVVNKLSNPSVIRSINLLLSQNPSLLNEWQAKALAETLGRELIQADHYVPIRRSELLRQISRAED